METSQERTDYVAVDKGYKQCGIYSRSVQPQIRLYRRIMLVCEKFLKTKTYTIDCSLSQRYWKFRSDRYNSCLRACPWTLLSMYYKRSGCNLILTHLFLARHPHVRAVCSLAAPVLPSLQWPIPTVAPVNIPPNMMTRREATRITTTTTMNYGRIRGFGEEKRGWRVGFGDNFFLDVLIG